MYKAQNLEAQITFALNNPEQRFYRDALRKSIELSELRPHYSPAFGYMGHAKYRLEDYEGALNALRKALEIDPDNHGALFTMGATLIKVGNYPQAIKLMEGLVEKDKDHMSYRYNLGLAQVLSGNYKDALQNFKAVYHKEKAPDSMLGIVMASLLAGQTEYLIKPDFDTY
jgi:tetratricopeptide (TPR) repeat protein